MRSRAISAVDAILGSQMAVAMGRAAHRGKLRVLAFHGVDDAETFDRQIAWLTTNFDVIAPEQMNDTRIPDHSVLVTFDDGDPSVVDIAAPILAEYEVKAVAFVCPSVVDTATPLWWQALEAAADDAVRLPNGRPVDESLIAELKKVPDDVRSATLSEVREAATSSGAKLDRRQLTSEELRAWTSAGHTIGNHTWSHPLLDRCSAETQRAEIQSAHDWLRDNMFLEGPMLFAYPNGNATEFSRDFAQSLGYTTFLFDHRVSPGKGLEHSRLRTNAGSNPTRFQAIVTGAHPALHRLRGLR